MLCCGDFFGLGGFERLCEILFVMVCYICDFGVFGFLCIVFDYNEFGCELFCLLSYGVV